ncbi:hypothetical protein GGR56DRAFT_657090 [Xylariaceae sp. FL0804]|nr:hypothetical protein GGR56DRAFT_657090 [Xylariaceae sp. FL0804]
MRLLWYAGTSTALAAGVVGYAFNQRANFYSAMVYLSQNNLSLMILINLILLIYSSFVWGLQRLCYGPLRPVEIEQLYEKAWFAVTETCLAMTIFREEVGAWFLVMFTALVTGKVWEWIGDGRVEVLEQQPPANPRLFHTRLSISLLLSVTYDVWLFAYAIRTVIQQARPNMMVMFLFEFAILATCSCRTAFRYILSLVEAEITRKQTKHRLEEQRRVVREQTAEILRRRELGDADALEEELPDEDDVDEMDIEVPGWESKGHWVLTLDLASDFVKLGIYSAFFAILMLFYGLPIHIMRDLFLTARSFVKRLGALMRYRKVLQDMNRYPDATPEDLSREDTCIICREEMRPWNPTAVGAVERSRPKKLPCGHTLHLGCLKGWMERQQVCPTCRRSVVIDGTGPVGDYPMAGANAGAQPPGPGQAAPGNGAGNAAQPAQGHGNMRVFQLGPLRLGFAQGNAQNLHDMAERLRGLDGANEVPPTPAPALPTPAPAAGGSSINSITTTIHQMQAQLQEVSERIQQEMYAIQANEAQLQALYAMTGELNRLRQQQHFQPIQPVVNNQFMIPQLQHQFAPMNQPMQPLQAFPNLTAHNQFINQPMQPLPAFPNLTTHNQFMNQPIQPIPAFPNLTTRTPQPSMTRHGGTNYTAAIPAGSPDLPEGVVIPPGWSLLPLQRLDGQGLDGQGQQQPSVAPQPTPTVPTGDGTDPHSQTTEPAASHVARDGSDTAGASSSTVPTASHVAHAESDHAGGSSRTAAEEPSGSDDMGREGHAEGSAVSGSQAPREPPDVAAPTPVMPNWGGAAQLFANGGIGTGTSSAATQQTEGPDTNGMEPPTTGDATGQQASGEAEEPPSSSSNARGKANAATVEDADDDLE